MAPGAGVVLFCCWFSGRGSHDEECTAAAHCAPEGSDAPTGCSEKYPDAGGALDEVGVGVGAGVGVGVGAGVAVGVGVGVGLGVAVVVGVAVGTGVGVLVHVLVLWQLGVLPVSAG
ncbi:MAG TPA: hypothetical protein VIM76_02585 [Candidatus Dormibacteraeota bacterium]|jgi:hypothetical protein